MLCAWEGLEIVSARTLLTLSHVPQRTPGQSTENPPVSPPQHRAVARGPAVVQGFGFHRASTGGSPTAPSPKAGLGWVTPTQQKGMQLRLGQKEASKGCN